VNYKDPSFCGNEYYSQIFQKKTTTQQNPRHKADELQSSRPENIGEKFVLYSANIIYDKGCIQ
jgi:hypothetical protein